MDAFVFLEQLQQSLRAYEGGLWYSISARTNASAMRSVTEINWRSLRLYYLSNRTTKATCR